MKTLHMWILSTAVLESDLAIALDFTKQFSERSSDWVQASCHFFKDLDFVIIDGKLEITDRTTSDKLTEADMVFFKTWVWYSDYAAAVVSLLEEHKIPYYNSEVANHRADTKVSELAAMAAYGLPVPDSYFCLALSIPTMLDFRANDWEFPMIMKSATASRGDANFRVNSFEDIQAKLAEHGELPFVFQPYIPNSYDYRVLVMGGEVVTVIKRSRQSKANNHLNNTSKGAQGELVSPDDLPKKLIRDSIAAATLFNRDVAGVDVMPVNDDDENFVILEVNKRPQMNTGAFVPEKMDAFTNFIKRVLPSKNS